MKKLQLLTVAMLTATITSQTVVSMDETFDAKTERQQHKTCEQKEAYYKFRLEKQGRRRETPEFRLILKAEEYRGEHENGKISLHQFHKIMDNKLKTFKENLERAGRAFDESAESFFHFCKHTNYEGLHARMEAMKENGEQFVS